MLDRAAPAMPQLEALTQARATCNWMESRTEPDGDRALREELGNRNQHRQQKQRDLRESFSSIEWDSDIFIRMPHEYVVVTEQT